MTVAAHRRSPRVTMQAIARRAGVSRTTVSFIVNGRDEELKISRETRDRVLQAIRELNYRPDVSARALQGQRTRTIGVLWSLSGYNPIPEMVNRLALMARHHDHASFLTDHLKDAAETLKTLEEFRGRRVDSIVIDADKTLLSDPLIVQALAFFDAAVAISPEPAQVPIDLIIHRCGPLYGQATRHLLAAGRQRLAIAMPALSNHEPKIEAVRQVLHARGKDPRQLIELRFATDYPAVEPVAGQQRLVARLQLEFPGRVPFDALLCASDEDAACAVHWLSERGLKVPADVAVVGANDTLLGRMLRPQLATGLRHDAQVAAAVEQLLFDRLKNPRRPPETVQIDMDFVWRESAGTRIASDVQKSPGGESVGKGN